jgi:hypothetical protein
MGTFIIVLFTKYYNGGRISEYHVGQAMYNTCKAIPQQAVKAHKVVRRRGSHIF